ncbi:MAG: amino acid ABC transporter substrate-binding protein [Eubacteriales bacterium]|nr:amino acid ABC transporter substrate-binding protein [Eubacteriales bacterium]
MKKLLSVLLVIAMAFAAVACAAPAAPAAEAPAPEAPAAPAAPAPADEIPVVEPEKDTSLEDVLNKGKLVLGMDDAFPPMGFRDDNYELTGFDVDLATEVCTRLGVDLEPTPIDWAQKIEELNTGNIDVIWNGFTITEERQVETCMTGAYMKNRQVMVVKADAGIKVLADLAGKKIALQADSSASEALDGKADFKASIDGGAAVEYSDNMKALLDLEIGGVDAVLMDEIVAGYYISQNNKPFVILEEALADEEYGIGCRKGSEALRDEIQLTLEAMAEDGTLAAISIKWFGKDLTTVK